MARLGVSPVIKLYDSDGTALASGTVETYITGTSTPKNSYTSSAGAGSATSFTLDSNGEAVRYFDVDAAYKLIIKDSSGTTVRTVDPYIPVGDFSSLTDDLDVNGYDIVSSSARDIAITPDSTGDLILDGLNWPQADGTDGQLLKTDGAGQLGWVSPSTDVVGDTSPQLGGDLDTNSFNIQFDDAHGIQDDAGNEQIVFNKTASAVNYIDVTNATTNNGPTIGAAGSDSNIDLNINAKGTGNVVISGLSYPTSDGSSGQALVTDGSGNLTFGSPAIAASQAQMEAASSSSVFTTPANLQYHPLAAKAWVVFDTDGTIAASHNTTSVADNGTGDYTITWGVTFSSTTFMVVGSIQTTSDQVFIHNSNGSTTTSTVYCWDVSAGAKGETSVSYIHAVAFGDLA